MKSYQILMFALLTNLYFTVNLQAQSNQNTIETVKRVYKAVENNDTSSLTDELLSSMKEQNIDMVFDPTDRYNISLLAILENRWISISINNLQIQQLDENSILVTGEFSGRQLTECEFITTKFIHEWSIKPNNNIAFTELTNNKNYAITKN